MIQDVPACSGMFRHVPECSGMFRVPGFIDALWLFTCVSTEVSDQMVQLIKHLVTLCTLIWLFTCVSTEVPGQMSQFV